MAQATPALEIRNLHKRYGALDVLKGISLAANDGAVISILGSSGSGKSTLLRCINLLEPADDGNIFFEGRDIAGEIRRAPEIRREIGMVFQNFELFQHLTAIENIMLAPMKVLGMSRSDAHDIAMDLLRKVRIPERADFFPDELSGGQQQRIAIARALAMKPKLMLYDEPTSALDPEMIREVLDVMTDLSSEGMTSIVVTHEMGFAKRAADQIVFMENGEVIENAPRDAFFGGAVNERATHFLDQILH